MVHTTSKWINGITLVLGYLWLVSGIDKIVNGSFVSGFANFVHNEYLGEGSYSWYVHFLNTFVLPHSQLFAYSIEWAELFAGIALLAGGAWFFFQDNRLMHGIIGLASFGIAFLALNIFFAEGNIFPLINLHAIYEEGVSMDAVVFFISLLIAGAHIEVFFKNR